jgi:hypothetical protein
MKPCGSASEQREVIMRNFPRCVLVATLAGLAASLLITGCSTAGASSRPAAPQSASAAAGTSKDAAGFRSPVASIASYRGSSYLSIVIYAGSQDRAVTLATAAAGRL